MPETFDDPFRTGFEESSDESLEVELIALKRNRALTKRALALAEAHLQAVTARHTAVNDRYHAIEGELEQRYQAAASVVGLGEPEPQQPDGTEPLMLLEAN